MKKAQMEAFGLVIIVFLLALGMFFMVSISGEEGVKAMTFTPQDVKLGQNMIDAIKNIKVDCPPIKRKVGLDELLQDMASYGIIYCNGVPSSIYAQEMINTTLQMTLVEWSKPFVFRVEHRGDDYIFIDNLNCTEDKPGEQGYQPFPLREGMGTVAMVLYVCN